MTKHIPNLLTLSNLLFGCLAIISVIKGKIEVAAYFILIAAVFDLLDGLFARILNATSEMGKQLDSLADLISFGLAPTIIIYNILINSELASQSEYSVLLILIFPLAAAWRLAKFNIDDSQAYSFKGLPSPAAGILLASFGLPHVEVWFHDIFQAPVILAVTWVLALLMVSSIKMFSMKFQNTSFKDNSIRYIFFVLCVLMISPIGFNFTLVTLIIILYIILALANSIFAISKNQ
ncbi:MAG: CDP-diacylglycerol--serine O-phosphatidyltransferase [Bacteroidia bacterium]|nr:CDP-diacylglycerol--serine O-phosphatidyltransferase [Bacteroidia bacterium]